MVSTEVAQECFLLGTREQLAVFAHRILRLLDKPTQSLDWHGVTVEQATSATALSDPMADITVHGIVLVNSEADRRVLMNAIRVNCGDLPIDWSEYDRGRQGAP